MNKKNLKFNANKFPSTKELLKKKQINGKKFVQQNNNVKIEDQGINFFALDQQTQLQLIEKELDKLAQQGKIIKNEDGSYENI